MNRDACVHVLKHTIIGPWGGGVHGACTNSLYLSLSLSFSLLSPLSFSEVEELGSKELELGDKSIIIEIKANEQGKFVKILEVCIYNVIRVHLIKHKKVWLLNTCTYKCFVLAFN